MNAAHTFATAKRVSPHNLSFFDARMALCAIGFVPLVHAGSAEHWVRDNRRIILYVEGEAAECVVDETDLKDAAYVEFVDVGGTLVAIPL